MLRCHYFDASALVKLVATDPDDVSGQQTLKEFFFSHSSKFATSFCMAEAFSTFKAKFVRKRITEDQYIHCVNEFIRVVVGSLEIDEINILSPQVTTEAKRLIQKYKIDFIDCFQIVTILKGKYSSLGPKSKSLLITADRDLASAAREEGAMVWECTTEPAPEYLT